MCIVIISHQAYINYNYYHAMIIAEFFPPLAGLFAFKLKTSQMIVKF